MTATTTGLRTGVLIFHPSGASISASTIPPSCPVLCKAYCILKSVSFGIVSDFIVREEQKKAIYFFFIL